MLYLTMRDFPRRVANRVQTMKMADAFACFCKLTLTVSRLHIPREEIFKHYGIRSKFHIAELGEPRFRPTTLALMPQTLKLIWRLRPDYIFIREENPAWLLSRITNNVIYEMHDFDPDRLWLYKGIVKKSRLTVVITEALRDKCRRYGIPDEKIIVLPDGVDLALFQQNDDMEKLRASVNLPRDRRIVLYSGRLSEWKGIYSLIESSRFLAEDVLVVLVGGFEGERDTVKEFIHSRGLNGKIFLPGYKDHSKIPNYLRAANVLALPNSSKTEISRYYTSPLKLFEYMAAQRPVVASDLPSIREVLDETMAILIEPDSPEKLAEGIMQALEDRETAALLAGKSFDAVQQYSWDERATKILSVLY